MRGFMIALLVVVGGIGSFAGQVEAQCSSSNKCEPVSGAAQYYCDIVCTTGSGCVNNGDRCPGHCNNKPYIACVNNTPCSSGDFCNYSTAELYGHCSNEASRGCNSNDDCVSPGTCGTATTTYGGEGTMTVCGTGSADSITLTALPDVVCAGSGNDTIASGTAGGADVISGGNGDDDITLSGDTNLVYAGDGADDIDATGGGASTIYAGDGNDQVIGSYYDDVIHGDAGNDILTSCVGRDTVFGDDGDDLVGNAALIGTTCRAEDSVLGSLLCGGEGDDELYGIGPGHQCFDAGPGQTSGHLNCFYAFDAGARTTQAAYDVATGKNCLNENHVSENSGGYGPVGCGCD